MANIVGAIGLAILAAALGPLVGWFFHSREVGIAAVLMAGTLPVTAAAIVPGALLQRRVSYRRMLFEPITVVAYSISSITLLAARLGIWGLIIATYIATATRTIGYIVLSRWRPELSLVSFAMWRSLARYGRHVLLSELFTHVGLITTTAVVGRAVGISALGKFSHRPPARQSGERAGDLRKRLRALSDVRADLRRPRALPIELAPVVAASDPDRLSDQLPLSRGWRTACRGRLRRVLARCGSNHDGVVRRGRWVALRSTASEASKARGRPEILPRLDGLAAVAPLLFMVVLLPLGAVGVGLALSIGALVAGAYALRKLAEISLLRSRRCFVSSGRPLSGAS